jgi:hypothetical protein
VPLLDHLLRSDACRRKIASECLVESRSYVSAHGNPPTGSIGFEEGSLRLVPEKQCRAHRRRLDGRERRFLEMSRSYGEQVGAPVRGESVGTEDGAGKADPIGYSELSDQTSKVVSGPIVSPHDREHDIRVATTNRGKGPDETINAFQRVESSDEQNDPTVWLDPEICGLAVGWLGGSERQKVDPVVGDTCLPVALCLMFGLSERSARMSKHRSDEQRVVVALDVAFESSADRQRAVR